LDRLDLRRSLVTLGIVGLTMLVDSLACNVPAFRYALERWPADLYQVVVYYQATPPRDALHSLRRNAGEGLTNYALKTVDVSKPEGRALAEGRKIESYPWVEVFYPVDFEFRGPVWSGPLNTNQVSKIVASPARSRMAQSLLRGEVAVWVLLKSGHEQKDRRARETLKNQLERASATLKIPEIGTDLNGNPVEVTDFKTYPVHFAFVEIARSDPDEQLLVSTLIKSESDLEQYDEPMAFPVFGRGRALYALVGDGIQENTILEACQSLINWCSCEIKAQNPGTDLIISADWSRPYGGKMVQDPDVPLTGLSGFSQDPEATKAPLASSKPAPIQPGAVCQVAPATSNASARPVSSVQPQPTGAGEGRLVRNILYLAGAAGLVLVTLSVVVTMKRKG